MLYNLYTVKDNKVGYGDVFCRVNDGLAKREFSLMVNRDEHMKPIAQDLELYCLGTYESDNGKITAKEPRFLTSGTAEAKENDHA